MIETILKLFIRTLNKPGLIWSFDKGIGGLIDFEIHLKNILFINSIIILNGLHFLEYLNELELIIFLWFFQISFQCKNIRRIVLDALINLLLKVKIRFDNFLIYDVKSTFKLIDFLLLQGHLLNLFVLILLIVCLYLFS